MHNEFKDGQRVIVCGIGENTGKVYKNMSAIIIERDPYYKDYHVMFSNGKTDWIKPKDIRKPYYSKKKGKK